MASSWVLVADNSQAKLYRFDRRKRELDLIDQIDHEEGRWKRQEFVAGGPGFSVASASGTHMMGTDNSPKTNESLRFAQLLAKSISHAHDLHQFETLRVCAPPKLLGEILPLVDKHVPLGDHINKDLVHEKPEQLLARLTELP